MQQSRGGYIFCVGTGIKGRAVDIDCAGNRRDFNHGEMGGKENEKFIHD